MSFRKVGFLALSLCFCLLASDLMAQPGGRGGRGRGGFGGFGSMQLLQNTDVQKKLDLSDDQIAEIKKVGEDLQAKAREAMQDRDFEALRGIMEDGNEEIKDVLLEKQSKMLTQIVNQQRYMRGGQLRISEQFLTETLEMSEGDAKKAMESYEKSVEAFREKMAEAAKKLIADFKKDLPKDARGKFEELIGDEIFQIQQQRGGFGGQRGGAQGGQRGGQRPQRGGGNNRPKGDDF